MVMIFHQLEMLIKKIVQPIVRQFEIVGNNKFKKVGGVLVFHY